MEQVSTIGLDIAKNVFQAHGIDETGEVVVRRQWRRRQVLAFFGRLTPCLIPTPIDQPPCAQLRMPIDVIRPGWSVSLFQASQQWATMSS